jgi:hypothetical protein
MDKTYSNESNEQKIEKESSNEESKMAEQNIENESLKIKSSIKEVKSTRVKKNKTKKDIEKEKNENRKVEIIDTSDSKMENDCLNNNQNKEEEPTSKKVSKRKSNKQSNKMDIDEKAEIVKKEEKNMNETLEVTVTNKNKRKNNKNIEKKKSNAHTKNEDEIGKNTKSEEDKSEIDEEVEVATDNKNKRKNNKKDEKNKNNELPKNEDKIDKNIKNKEKKSKNNEKTKKQTKKTTEKVEEVSLVENKQEIIVEIANNKKRKHDEIVDTNENSKASKNSKIKLNHEKNEEDIEIPKIAFTGIDDHYFKIVKDLGGIVEESWENCTHLVTDKIRRTVKFLCVLATGKKIVSLNWIKASKKSGKFLDPSKYILKDAASEKKWKFSIKNSLNTAFENKDHPLFKDLTFYMTPNTKPPYHEMETIINAAGGTLINELPKEKIDDIIILSCPDDEQLCETLVKQGYDNIHSNEFILSGILKQVVDYKSYKIKLDNSKSHSVTNGRKRKR